MSSGGSITRCLVRCQQPTLAALCCSLTRRQDGVDPGGRGSAGLLPAPEALRMQSELGALGRSWPPAPPRAPGCAELFTGLLLVQALVGALCMTPASLPDECVTGVGGAPQCRQLLLRARGLCPGPASSSAVPLQKKCRAVRGLCLAVPTLGPHASGPLGPTFERGGAHRLVKSWAFTPPGCSS